MPANPYGDIGRRVSLSRFLLFIIDKLRTASCFALPQRSQVFGNRRALFVRPAFFLKLVARPNVYARSQASLNAPIHLSGAYHFYSGFLFPQFMQKLPVLTVPQLQVHSAGAGFLFPQFMQKLPVLTVPQLQVQEPADGAAIC